MIKLIVACTKDRVIGLDNKMPWNIKEELEFFKETTINHSLLMGRKTFEGLGKVLKNRTTYVLTSDSTYKNDHPNVIIVNEVDKLFEKFSNSEETLFIAGGAKIYEQYYQYADELFISIINEKCVGNVILSDFDLENYSLIYTEKYNEFSLFKYKRKC